MPNTRLNALRYLILVTLVLSLLPAPVLAARAPVPAFQASTFPVPAVAIHVSELTQALETTPASPPTPTGAGTTGYQWWPTSWHYFVMYESLKEALRSDGTPFVTVSDADIAAGRLLNPDGSPKYPIVISLASEAIADTEIAPLRNYVAAGGFLMVGSSAFTRNPNGTTRGDFALANEMGLHMVSTGLQNWAQNTTFTKAVEHRLVSHIPSGTLAWYMPLTSEEIPWGVSPSHPIHESHYVWQVRTSDATVVANGDNSPLLTTKSYGQGQFIYHGAMQPLIGHGGLDSGMYAYGIYRNVIEWAFASADLPIVKLSPWRYPYDAAFMVRHDFENDTGLISSIEASAQFEASVGVKGDYYFTTGAIRIGSEDTRLSSAEKTQVIASLQRAVSLYGATIGSHNGGLKNPVNLSLQPGEYEYWHWGPDEALDTTPSGYANGKAYAYSSIHTSFLDIEGWLSGYDNGRSGCGIANNCPRTWVSPFFNSTREASYDILQQLGAITMGEQKIGPFPHWTLSTQTAGKRYASVTPPVSDWYIGSSVAQSLESGFSTSTIQALVDAYYNLGALINLYGHTSSTDALQKQYVTYSAAKPRIWATNAVDVYDWWSLRSNVIVTPAYSRSGNTIVASASITGATDPQTSVELVIPSHANSIVTDIQVFINGAPANPTDYRTTSDGLKVRVGASGSEVEVRYTYTRLDVSVFWDDLDPVKESWTHAAALGTDDWSLTTDYSHSPTTAYFCSEPGTIKDDYLLTRSFVVPANAQLSFWHTYQLESDFDGAVVEVSTDGGATFIDLQSHITQGAYTGRISTEWGSPIGGRPAWTGGILGAMNQVAIDLSSYTGQNVIVRFRLATDSGVAGGGWYIDDVRVAGSATQDQYALAVNIVGSGTVARNPDQATYSIGAVVTLTATPAVGWTFAGWSGALTGSVNPRALTVDANKVVTASFTETGVNEAPVVSGIPDQTIAEGTSFATIALDNYVTDVDNTDAEMTWTYTGNTALTVSIVDRVAMIGTPSADWNGAETITFRATDPGALYDEDAATFTVTGVNDAPVITGQGALATNEDTALNITLSALTVTDVDNAYPTGFSLTVLPGMNYTVEGATITPASNFNGTLTVPVTVNDGATDSNTYNLSVTVTAVNDAPVAADDSYRTNKDVALTVAAPGVLSNDSDADSNSLSAVKVSDPSHGTLTLDAAGSFTYTPAADYSGLDSFTYKANDGADESNVAIVNLTVAPLPPVVSINTVDLTLTWSAVSGATGGYNVYQSTTEPYFTPNGSPDWVESSPYPLPGNTTNYYYIVRAVSGSGQSDNSNRVGRFTFTVVPGTLP